MINSGDCISNIFKLIILFILVPFTFTSIAQEQKNPQTNIKVNKIICILPLTGEYSVLGNMALRAVLAAKETVGGGRYELVVIDTGLSDIPTVFDKALEKYDPSFVIGPLPSYQLEELKNISIKSSEIPVLVFPVEKNNNIRASNLVRFFYPADMQINELVDFISNNKRISKFAVLYPDNKMGSNFRDSYKSAVLRNGGSLTYEGAYNPNTMDISSELHWIETLKPDVIFIPDGASRSSIVIKKVLENRSLFNTFFIGPSTWNSDAFVRDIDTKIDGIIYKTLFTDFIDMESSEWKTFRRIYRELFAHDPGPFQYRVYSAASLLIDYDNKGDLSAPLLDKLKNIDNAGKRYRIESSEKGIDIYPEPMIFTLMNNEVIRLK